MSNVVAGIGRGQLLHLDEHRARKEAIYRRYAQGLKELPLRMNPYEADKAKPNFWLSCLLMERDAKPQFMDLFNGLNELNVETRPIWKPMHMQPVFKGHDFISIAEKPVDEDVFSRGLCLPSDIKMTEQEQDFVIEALKTMF